MAGAAAKAVADLPVEDPVPAPPGWLPLTYDAVIRTYESRFVTTAASDTARAEFTTARQMTAEPILEWHGRLRDLFKRAYPLGEIDLGASGQLLRDRFVQGLDITAIREYVLDARPNNYADCLESASNKYATLLILQGGRSHKLNTIGAVNVAGTISSRDRNGQVRRCFYCGEVGHFLRECKALDRDRALKLPINHDTLPGRSIQNGEPAYSPLYARGNRGRGKKETSTGKGRPRAAGSNPTAPAVVGPGRGPRKPPLQRRINAINNNEVTEVGDTGEEEAGNDQGRE